MNESLPDPVVFVVDDDADFSKSVRWLLTSVNHKVELFARGQDFLDAVTSRTVGCLVVDVRMPGMSGLELQRKLTRCSPDLPVIIMTAHGEIDMAVRAMKDGAMDFIQKPFNDQVFLDLVNSAIEVSQENARIRLRRSVLLKRLERLTSRERQVLDLIVEGNTNKQIARILSISEKTVEVHRARVMDKTRVKSLPGLVKLVLTAKPDTGKP